MNISLDLLPDEIIFNEIVLEKKENHYSLNFLSNLRCINKKYNEFVSRLNFELKLLTFDCWNLRITGIPDHIPKKWLNLENIEYITTDNVVIKLERDDIPYKYYVVENPEMTLLHKGFRKSWCAIRSNIYPIFYPNKIEKNTELICRASSGECYHIKDHNKRSRSLPYLVKLCYLKNLNVNF